MTDPQELAEHQQYPEAALYVVATPIGNTADITLRALHLLRLCHRIAAEDTRNTAQLLARYGIVKPLIAAHTHNEREAATRIVEHLQSGERVAYVSDAGTPGISDPGGKIVDAVRAAGFAVIPLPGCSALATALSVAGSWVSSFTFVGFAPARAGQRDALFKSLVSYPHALVFYEAPHRIVDTVDALLALFGPTRRILIARELTKLHESAHACTLAEAPVWLGGDANRRRGEFVLVVEGREQKEDDGDATRHDALLTLLLEEMSVSAAARLAAKLTGTARNALYARALALSAHTEEEAQEPEQDDDA